MTRSARRDALLLGAVWILTTLAAALAARRRIRQLRREGW
jgi:hypothetical protein